MPRLQSPLKNLNLLRYPAGNVFQYYGENCALYTAAFAKMGSPSKCHNGIDCVTFEGDEIIAAHDGFILKADFGETTHGNGIWLQGNDAITCYFHLKEMFVKNGDIIKKGQVIGTEGNTGFVVSGGVPFWGDAPNGKGVHLHFGVYPLLNGQLQFPNNNQNGAVDPIPWLRDKVEADAISAIDKAKQVIKQFMDFWKGRSG